MLRTRGHPAALTFIRNAIDREHAPHALLLIGPRGCGKTTLAMDLAAGLLCLAEDPIARPCRACAACRKVEHGNHPDLHRLVAEGAGEQIRLTQVQSLASDLALLPMEGRVRMAIIESAQRLNPDAQNALLKTLEEPTGAACIILCADDAAPILPTVVSRSARIRLGPLPRDVVAELLVERGVADRVRAGALAAAAGCLPGLALALASRPEAMIIGDRLARTLLDLLAADRRTRLAAVGGLLSDGMALDAALRGGEGESDEAPASRGSKRPQPAERRRGATRVLGAWREVGRDLAVVAGGGRGEVHRLDLLEDLQAAAPLVERGPLVAFLDRLDGLGAAIEAYASPELVLDDLVLSWPRTERAA